MKSDVSAIKRTVVMTSAGRHQMGRHMPSWRKESSARVYARYARGICFFFRKFMGLSSQKFSWSLFTRNLYTRKLACEPPTGS